MTGILVPHTTTTVSSLTNYEKISKASQDVLPELLQHLLATKLPQSRLNSDVHRNRHLFLQLSVYERSQINKARTRGYSGFGIPLIYKLVRNLKLVTPPSKGWDSPGDPNPDEITLGDDIERVLRIRNKTIHRGNTYVSALELKETFDLLKNVARRLEQYLGNFAEEYVKALIRLENGFAVDENSGKVYGELLKYRDEDLSKEVDNVLYTEPRFPQFEDIDEFGELMSKGKYASFNNTVYLGGACNVGKTTLANILIGGDVPPYWKSTDCLDIFFGRFGINLESKEMVPFSEGNSKILTKVLIGQPEIKPSIPIENTKNKKSGRQPAHETKIDFVNGETTSTITTKTTDKAKTKKVRENASQLKRCVTEESQDLNESHVAKKPKSQAKSFATINNEIKEELKRGTYKVRIAPSDLVDFGGQRSYDMTHQLFIRHKGVFVLMMDGRKNLYDVLEEYPQGDVTTASILLHWVTSILTYCGVDDNDIVPLIIFVATHSDSFSKLELETRKKKISRDIETLFVRNENHQRILYDSLYFINTNDKSDVGIKDLKAKLVDVACQQSSWGQEMPMAWVPLELQISEMRQNGEVLISTEELSNLNTANEDMALSEKQLRHFLRSQHSLGRIMYFDFPGLESFIIIHPRTLVDILRSVITDEIFWPKHPNLNKILRHLTESGRITKQDLFMVWSQKKFNHSMPTKEVKNFIAKVLVYLDILVTPKTCIEADIKTAEFYLVPCIINRSKRKMTIDYPAKRDKTICLSYRLLKSDVPSAVSYKLIGALLNMWPVKKIDQDFCLFHKAAILCIDGNNELSVFTKENKILVYLTNIMSNCMISPNIASVAQECITATLEDVLLFYQNSFGKEAVIDPEGLFEMEVGEVCKTAECLISISEAQKKTEWTCSYGKNHKVKTCMLWIKKESENCSSECNGLDEQTLQQHPTDRHLIKLASQIETEKIQELVTNLGLKHIELNHIGREHERSPELIKSFACLCKCRTKMESERKKMTFEDLAQALSKIHLNKHYLCEAFKENVGLFDSSSSNYQNTPDDQLLEDLAVKIGNCAIHLGVELGLKLTQIEQIIYKNHKNCLDKIEIFSSNGKGMGKIKPNCF